MAAPDEREVNRRRMAWPLAGGLAFVCGIAHVLSLRFVFLLCGVALIVAGALLVRESRRGVRGAGRVVAWVGAVPLFLWNALSLVANVGSAPELARAIGWPLVLAGMLALLHWGAPDGRVPATPRRDPGLV